MAADLKALTPPPVANPLRSWFYMFRRGYLYASSTLASTSTKQCASLLVSCNGEPFEVECEGQTLSGRVLSVRPELERRVNALGVPVLSCGLSPAHRLFRSFTLDPAGEPHAAVRVLDDLSLTAHADEMKAALDGRLTAGSAAKFTDALMQAAADALGAPPALDTRIARVMALLEQDTTLSPEHLANEVQLSYYRLSHLFSEAMGVSLRTCLIGLRVDRAGALASSGTRLTDVAFAAGFADSAHFSKTWSRACGASPSRFFNDQRVGLITEFELR
jgi:AraC-like DNA-binding protein